MYAKIFKTKGIIVYLVVSSLVMICVACTKDVKNQRNTVTLEFYSSSAKKTWIDEVTEKFNRQRNQIDGQSIHINVTHVTSGGSLRKIKERKIQPDIWSPGDDSWIKLANDHWNTNHSGRFIRETKPLVNVPLVIAIWEPMARALGYPDKPLGWTDIAEVAANPDGWAAYGHPEWGKFKWGHAHPEANSGFLTVLSEIYSCLGKTKNMAIDDLKNPEVRTFLKAAESAVEHYGMSNSWIDEFMRKKGPSYLSAATQYENAIIESNRMYGSKPFKLVAIYPKEGAFWTQHPIGIPEEAWVTPMERRAAERYIAYLLEDETQRKAMKIGLRPISQTILLEEPFTSEYGVQAEIDSSNIFLVPNERVLRRVRELWEEAKMPASIVLLIDVSGSMRGKPIKNAKKGAITFIRKMSRRDELEVITFSDEAETLIKLGQIRENSEAAKMRIWNLRAGGYTCLYDAIKLGLTTVRQRKQNAPDRRYGIIVLSDGVNTRSTIEPSQLMNSLPKGDNPNVTKLFTIAYGSKANRDFLNEIADATNARMFRSTDQEIEKVYRELSANF